MVIEVGFTTLFMTFKFESKILLCSTGSNLSLAILSIHQKLDLDEQMVTMMKYCKKVEKI